MNRHKTLDFCSALENSFADLTDSALAAILDFLLKSPKNAIFQTELKEKNFIFAPNISTRRQINLPVMLLIIETPQPCKITLALQNLASK